MGGVVWTPRRDGGHMGEPEPGAARLEGTAQTWGAGHETLNIGGAVLSMQVSCPQGACGLGQEDSPHS